MLLEEITHIKEENIAKLERIRMLSYKQVLEKQIINQYTIRRQLTEASKSSNYTNKSSNKEDFAS